MAKRLEKIFEFLNRYFFIFSDSSITTGVIIQRPFVDHYLGMIWQWRTTIINFRKCLDGGECHEAFFSERRSVHSALAESSLLNWDAEIQSRQVISDDCSVCLGKERYVWSLELS
jgi:hypothetical protein